MGLSKDQLSLPFPINCIMLVVDTSSFWLFVLLGPILPRCCYFPLGKVLFVFFSIPHVFCERDVFKSRIDSSPTCYTPNSIGIHEPCKGSSITRAIT